MYRDVIMNQNKKKLINSKPIKIDIDRIFFVVVVQMNKSPIIKNL